MMGVYHYVIKMNGFVLKYKQGSVLLYTLVIFLGFTVWFEGVLYQRMKKFQETEYLSMIEDRLSDQKQILQSYKTKCIFDEESDICEYEIIGVNMVYWIVADEYIIEVYDEYGKSLKKYDIMRDGSVLETITEETL